jgi:hypothetical protein
MWNLTPESVTILESLARECSQEGEEVEKTLKILVDGFSRYSEEAINKLASHKVPKERRFYDSWEAFYRDRQQMLLENIGRAGQTSEQAFLSVGGREELCQLVRTTTGVHSADVEDIVQDISLKFLKGEELRLMPAVADVDSIPTEGRRLVIIAAVNNVLHFRVFNGVGKLVVDTDETELTIQVGPIEDLRGQLQGLWPPHAMTESEQDGVIAAVASIVGHALGDYAEKYNPLIAPWGNYLREPIRRYVISYYKRKNTRVLAGVVSLDWVNEQDDSGRTLASCLHDLDQVWFPERRLIGQETMRAWEEYLNQRNPIRITVRNLSGKLCTLLPPGIGEIPTTVDIDVFFLQGGLYNSRVTTKELYELGICPTVPNQQLVDYISEDSVTHAQYIDVVTGDFVTQKHFPNPHPDPAMVIKEQRTWMELYTLLMQGLQADEIARALRMAPTSMSGRIKKLEKLFREFCLASSTVPQGEIKLRAAKSYRCPHCRRLDVIQRETCCDCGTDMRGEVAKVRFKDYPWGRVRVTRATFVRLGEPKQKKEHTWVRRGSISTRL